MVLRVTASGFVFRCGGGGRRQRPAAATAAAAAAVAVAGCRDDATPCMCTPPWSSLFSLLLPRHCRCPLCRAEDGVWRPCRPPPLALPPPSVPRLPPPNTHGVRWPWLHRQWSTPPSHPLLAAAGGVARVATAPRRGGRATLSRLFPRDAFYKCPARPPACCKGRRSRETSLLVWGPLGGGGVGKETATPAHAGPLTRPQADGSFVTGWKRERCWDRCSGRPHHLGVAEEESR